MLLQLPGGFMAVQNQSQTDTFLHHMIGEGLNTSALATVDEFVLVLCTAVDDLVVVVVVVVVEGGG